jgi:hypothetical protein
LIEREVESISKEVALLCTESDLEQFGLVFNFLQKSVAFRDPLAKRRSSVVNMSDISFACKDSQDQNFIMDEAVRTEGETPNQSIISYNDIESQDFMDKFQQELRLLTQEDKVIELENLVSHQRLSITNLIKNNKELSEAVKFHLLVYDCDSTRKLPHLRMMA